MVGLGIVAVRYNVNGMRDSGISLLRLKTFKYDDGKILIPRLPHLILRKAELIGKENLYVLKEESGTEYELGSPVIIVKNEYLRTDGADEEKDDLGYLPEF